MQGSDFDEIAFFRSADNSGVRALLIGSRALVILGLPVLTADYTIPSLEDLIATKRIRPRPKDLEDIRLLEALRSREAP